MNSSAKYLRPEVLHRISSLELRARTVVEGFFSGLHQSPYRGFSVEFAEHREYSPGDDLRHIDWRVFAKSDRYYIKQYEEETNLRAQLVLDCSGSMAYPEQRPGGRMNKWEYAATVAACLAYLLAQQQDAIGLTLFDEHIRRQLSAVGKAGQLSNVIEVVEKHQPSNKTQVKALFRHLADRIRQRGLIVIISDFLTDLADIREGLQRLRHLRHEVLALHVLDHDEVEFPFVDRTSFEGLEAEQEILADPQALRASYLEQVRGFIRRLRSMCANHGVDYTLLTTVDPPGMALASFLAKRMQFIRAQVR